MEVIISANEKVLLLIKDKEVLSEDMNKENFLDYINKIEQNGVDNDAVQEIPV